MESGRSDFARAAGEASAGSRKEKKNCALSNVLIFVGERRQAVVTETTSAWTGKKKTKIQRGGKIVGGQEHDREEIEGLDWDDAKLANEIDVCRGQLNHAPLLYQRDLDESSYLDEEQLRLLNQRLALCRIRAHEERYQDMDDESLLELFPHSNLEAKGYYKHYEISFEWFFDPVYCRYADLEDYQRLTLKKNGAYEDWEYYHKICSSLESDLAFVEFWKKLSSKTKLIELYMTRMKSEPRIERLFYYHALKIAAGYPDVYKTLINSGFIELRHKVQIEFTWYRRYADFLFMMWKMLTGEEKLSFERVLRRVFDDGKCSFIFMGGKFERNLGTLEDLYKPLLDRIGEETDEEYVKGLIMKFIEGNDRIPRTYYDYVTRKLSIAKKIGLIPSTPQKLNVTKQFMVRPKQGIGSKEG